MEDNRYSRQQLVPGFGPEAQKKLSQARVLVVGAGGLGLPVLLALAGAGVGTLGVCDFDTVSLSNLHRQTVFKTAEVGQPKAELAAAYLRALNPELHIRVHASGIQPDAHLKDLLSDYDVIVDGSDNFETRYLVNDSCALLGLPLVFGAIFRDSGHAVLLHHPDAAGYAANYRDLFPALPAPGEVPNCAEAGVLGVLPGIIGNMMAAETLSFIVGKELYLHNTLCLFSLKGYRMQSIRLVADPKGRAAAPANWEALLAQSYAVPCGLQEEEIPWETALRQAKTQQTILLDVREEAEQPKLEINPNRLLELPLSRFEQEATQVFGKAKVPRQVAVFCQSGIRSKRAVATLKTQFPEHQFIGIAGGINAWIKHNNDGQ